MPTLFDKSSICAIVYYESLGDGMENEKRSIPRRWVKELGANASYVMAILCQLQLTDAEYPYDKPVWFVLTTKELAERFPLLEKTAISDIVKKLKAKHMLLIKRGLKVASKTLGYSVPDAVMAEWRCQDERVCFNVGDSIRCNGIAPALVVEVLCRNFAANITKKNRHAISRETGLPVTTVSDIIKRFKDKPDAFLQSLQARRIIPDDTGKIEPVWEMGSGYRIKDAQGNVTYTRDLEVAKLALAS